MATLLADIVQLGHKGMKHYGDYDVMLKPSVLYGPPIAYVVCALIGHFVMQDRKPPAWVNSAMRLYNIGQILLCLYMTWGLMPVLYDGEPLKLGSITLPNIFGINSEYTADAEWFVFVHYLSKYYDWCDTLWMILKKKSSEQMSFLHLYHHATIGVVWGFVLSTGHGNGSIRYGAWINSVTHVIMYGHYLWTSFGLKNPFKAYITMWQIFQFYTCFTHAICLLFVFREMETRVPIPLAWIQFCYHITMIYLFTFKLRWVPSFIKGTATKEEAAKKKTK
eukprot:TRINITY_DN1875_c0_g2_i1.p1 TRINITY_DN1875_c0_g2~~TRINITY_DN1875_c0_g2_i1.p1  ORF type:complete len:303 (+),score=61.62 TRINITY_DN1875_c0_g2_i1:76-909(+)